MTGTTRRGFFGILGAALAAVGLGRRGEAGPQGRGNESFGLTAMRARPSAPREVCRVPGCAMHAIGGGYCRLHGGRCAARYTECTFVDYDPALYSVGPTLEDCKRRGEPTIGELLPGACEEPAP